VKLIPRENEQLSMNKNAKWWNDRVSEGETIATVFNMWPTVPVFGAPLGVGVGTQTGGFNWAGALSAAARAAKAMSDRRTAEGVQASLLASYIRREQDWTLQANLAAKEIIQLDKQITAADIRIQIAKKELENHKQQIENAKAVEQFLKGKFTNQALYQWMKEQLFAVYKQAYNLAYDMAKKVEKAYKYELGTELVSFIQYGYWADSRQGLVAGEKLQLALRQMEKSYLEENRRELELSKDVSLARLNPQALIELRETGKCYVSLPEELFDLDFRGHYFRRIRAVRMSIPCVAGPHTSVSCSLRLLNNRIRINTAMNSEGKYEHENDEGLWIDDDRFRVNHVPVKAIATSLAQNDSGMFEFSFRDERYLQFERAGAISEWEIELSTDVELRPFDYATISDVMLNLSYTAREQGGLFKESASTYVKDFLSNAADLADQPLVQMFTMRHEYPTEWHRFLHPAVAGDEQVLAVTLGRQRFPYLVQNRTIVVMQIQVFARCTGAGDYHMLLSHMNFNGDPVNSSEISLPKSGVYGDLNVATVGVTDASLNLEELDVAGPMTLKLKHNATPDYTGLATNPPEIEDLDCLVHYKLH
jgi:hypothetical protein